MVEQEKILVTLITKGNQSKHTLVEKYGSAAFEEVVAAGAICCTPVGYTTITPVGREVFNQGWKGLLKHISPPPKQVQSIKPTTAKSLPKPRARKVKTEATPEPKKPKRPRSKLDPRLCEKNYTRTFDKIKVSRMILLLEGKEYDVQTQEISVLAQEWGMKLRLVRDKAYRLGLLGIHKFTPWNDPLELRLVLKLHKIGASQALIAKESAKKGWHRSRSMTYRKLQSMGLVQSRAPEWRQEEKDFLTTNYSKMTFTEMSNHIKRSPDAINMKAVRMGLQKPKKVQNAKS